MFISRKWAAGLALTASAALCMASAQAANMTGAGSSFAAPIYTKWASAYQQVNGSQLNYQSIGSGGGIQQVKAKTVDFGASDMPLTPDELKSAGLVQFPTVTGGVVPVVNIPGIKPGQIHLTGPVLADIYMGKITKWNDKAIADLNPGVSLPNQLIAVVRRADGSGTTFIFTNYLSKVSPEWKTKIGQGTVVQWPVGLGGKGSEGVSAFIQRIPYSLGYVEYAYAKENKMAYALVANADGKYVQPNNETFKAAAAHADWSHDFYEILTNEPGAHAWPISGATFILMHKVADKPQQSAAVLSFFNWAYAHGDKMAEQLEYVPLPDSTVKLIKHTWAQIKDASGAPVWK